MYGDLQSDKERMEWQQKFLKKLKKFQDDYQQLRTYPPKQYTYAE